MMKSLILHSRTCMAAGFAAILATAPLPQHGTAMAASGGQVVQGLYDTLLGAMKNGRILGQSGRFAQIEPVVRRSFDIPTMARLAVGPSWATLTEAQRQQVTDSFGRYISAIYADRFDSYAGQRLEVTGEQPAAAGRDGAQPDRQGQRRAGQGRLSDAPRRQ